MPDDDTLTADAPPDDATAEASPPAAPPEEPAALEAPSDPVREARWTRLILPILLPTGAAVAMAVFVLNLSRIYLAAGDTGALILGSSMIVVILGGAAILSAAPRMRTSSLTLILAGLFFVVMAAGLVAAPRTAPHPASNAGNGLVNPKGVAVSTLQIQALPALRFQASQFTVKAGIVNIQYVSEGGNHTLAFDDPRYSSFLLMAPGGPSSAKVLLKPGSYTVFCTVPGHRQAGMVATITAQ